MLRFHFVSRYPDYLSQDRLHILTSRQTLFGVHLPTHTHSNDRLCTKTHIISFVREEDAQRFRRTLENFQHYHKYLPDRIMDGSADDHRKTGSLLHLHVEALDAHHLEKACAIHWFNLLVVHSIQPGSYPFQDLYECFLYDTPSPSQEVVRTYLQDMYRKPFL